MFAVIEVWSRLWASTVVGKRTYQTTLSVFRNLSSRMNLEQISLVVTDGFGFYEKVIRRVFGPTCLYGQVIKLGEGEGGAKSGAWGCVEIGTGAARLRRLNETEHVVCRTPESDNPTGLSRRTICQALQKQRLNDHLGLLRCHYNFVRLTEH